MKLRERRPPHCLDGGKRGGFSSLSCQRRLLTRDRRNNLRTIDDLFALHDQFGSYPDGVIPIQERIRGIAFFPGGSGLWNSQPNELPPPLPIGGVIVVGHNFDSETGFERSFSRGGENLKGATWRNLLAFL